MPQLDEQLLREFERELDPRHPEGGPIPARVLGYGEISTVFEVDAPGAQGWALKRMPMFRNEREADAYTALYRRYTTTLTDQIGLTLPPSEIICVSRPEKHYVALYIAQEKLPLDAIGHRAIHLLAQEGIMRLVRAVLAEQRKVFNFNRQNRGVLELGLDGQISNWCISAPSGMGEGLPDPLNLIYFDTSTPLMRVDGKEQLNPELLLRSAPSFLLWLVRRAFLPEVMTRYYDFRRVAIDLVANFYKEGRPELVPELVQTVNTFFGEGIEKVQPLTVKEIEDYYRFDALIWRVYLALRRLDRVLARASRRQYQYILPGKLAR